MDSERSWEYDEFRQVGKDYGQQAEVEIYDSSHADFRDADAESRKILSLLEIGKNDALIDFGSGTGSFAIQAASCCKTIHAVDVSDAMIEYAKAKAVRAGISNIRFHHAGFLSYEHKEAPVDAVVTTFALHHLPDFWKGIALKRINRLLKPGARLYLHDVILEDNHAIENIASLIEKQAAAGGDFLRKDAEEHFRDEYSTYDWVIDGLLNRSGFDIRSKQIEAGVIGTYLCIKSRDPVR